MKKNKDEFELKLEQELEQYFEDVEVPEMSEHRKEELRNLVAQNKLKRKRITLWRKITAVASAVCLIALIIIPTVIMLNKKDNTPNPPTNPPTYYGKGEATKIQHTLEETQTIINTSFPKYNFMFTDLTYISSKGFYHPEDETLLAIQIIFNESEIPYTQVEIHIVASEQFVFDDQPLYTANAEHTTTSEFEMYKFYQLDIMESMRGYIIYKDHEIYINLARINDTLFNKFI